MPFVLAHLDRYGELPMTFWFRSMAGPVFWRLGRHAQGHRGAITTTMPDRSLDRPLQSDSRGPSVDPG